VTTTYKPYTHILTHKYFKTPGRFKNPSCSFLVFYNCPILQFMLVPFCLCFLNDEEGVGNPPKFIPLRCRIGRQKKLNRFLGLEA
jgi:hypothetical protein